MRLIAFDLDGTLAEIGKSITLDNIKILKELEDKGIRIAIASGKPIYYLSGLVRQIELKNPILIGENGANIQIGMELPPSEYYILPYAKRVKDNLLRIKMDLEQELPTMWFQPNVVGVTPFPKNKEEIGVIEEYIEKNPIYFSGISIYRHKDSFDFTPNNMNKRNALEFVGNLLSISAKDMVAVGDSKNDYPMFSYVGTALGINIIDKGIVHYNCKTIEEALHIILNLL